MVVCKWPYLDKVPESCDWCHYHESRPDPFVGWRDSCAISEKSLDEDNGDEGWQWDGDGRPPKCPLMEIDDEGHASKKKNWQRFDNWMDCKRGYELHCRRMQRSGSIEDCMQWLYEEVSDSDSDCLKEKE